MVTFGCGRSGHGVVRQITCSLWEDPRLSVYGRNIRFAITERNGTRAEYKNSASVMYGVPASAGKMRFGQVASEMFKVSL
jgi:hypothetical protein